MKNTQATILPVILCGGSGTRLWPLSRAGFPKQFLSLAGDATLFQQAVERLAGVSNNTPPLIVGNEDHRFLAMEQLREIGVTPAAMLLEPVGRNTAPALTMAALAAMEAMASGDDPVLVVTPADQTIGDVAVFASAMHEAIERARVGEIVILGVTPTAPHTGYGYIQAGDACAGDYADDCAKSALVVRRFVEKPDLATAQSYLDAGHYFWNAGMFVLRASVWLAALARLHAPMHAAALHAWSTRSTDGVFVRPDKAAFAAIPADSVDYAVLEKCPGSEQAISVVPLAAGWSDLGAWDAVWAIASKDAQGNAVSGDAMLVDCRNTLVQGSGRLVALVGLENVVVVETADAVLVADRARSQEVKAIVDRLTAAKRPEKDAHRKVQRPWGWYDSVDEGERFKVKRILVNPGASLSLQMHYHRAEHWVVVSGTAEITNGEDKIILSENQSTYIPLGQTHRLANPGTIPLEIVEVQSGSYLGEDDIVRFADTYGRSGA
jgi:mannose-1-phosphate guanylyltransferase / mannose-6-phosphate isomerase